MNKQNRKMIEGYINQLQDLKDNIEAMMDEEEEKYNDSSEGLLSLHGEAMEEAINNLGCASDSIGDAIDYLSELM